MYGSWSLVAAVSFGTAIFAIRIADAVEKTSNRTIYEAIRIVMKSAIVGGFSGFVLWKLIPIIYAW